jgi:hypothetical protein
MSTCSVTDIHAASFSTNQALCPRRSLFLRLRHIPMQSYLHQPAAACLFTNPASHPRVGCTTFSTLRPPIRRYTALHLNMVLASDIVDLASLSSAQTSLPPPPIPQPCHSTSPESFLISLLCSSVNDHIPAEWAALKYSTVDQAIALGGAQGPGAIFIKRDLQDAVCHMPRYCPSGPLTTGFFAGKDPIGWNASYPSACGQILITLTFSPKRCIGFLILRQPRSMRSFTTLTTFSKYHRQKQRCRLTADMKADLRWWQRFLPC